MIKQYLLNIKIVFKFNALLKSFSLRCKYDLLRVYYFFKRNKLVELPRLNTDRPNVIFIGTDIRQDKSGFYQDLCKSCNMVIPFVKENGEWGQYSFADSDCKYKNINRLKQIIDGLEINIDILLMQSWGMSFDCENLNELKRKYGFIIINIDMDSRLIYKKFFSLSKQNDGISGLNKCVDLALVTVKEICDWYRKDGVAALYFPLASSCEFYYPIDGIKKEFDVGFIGTCYGVRKDVINFLIKNGVKVCAYGKGFPSGEIDYSQNNYFFNKCKIVLGIGNISYCKNFFNPKLRDYDATMSGAIYLTNKTKELEDDFDENVNIFFYQNKKDLLLKINKILNMKEDKLQLMRLNTHNFSKHNHSYYFHLKKLWKDLNEFF